MTRSITLLVSLFMMFAIAACEPDTTSEQAADHIEDAGDELRAAAEDVGDEVKNSGDDLQAAAEDVGNEIEDACEEMKQEAGAENTNC